MSFYTEILTCKVYWHIFSLIKKDNKSTFFLKMSVKEIVIFFKSGSKSEKLPEITITLIQLDGDSGL